MILVSDECLFMSLRSHIILGNYYLLCPGVPIELSPWYCHTGHGCWLFGGYEICKTTVDYFCTTYLVAADQV